MARTARADRKQQATWESDLLESLADGVVVVDEKGRIVYANRQTERLTGYERGELLGSSIERLVPARLRTIHRQHRRAYVVRPRPRPMGPANHDFSLRRKDGTELAVDIALSPTGQRGSRLTAAAIRDASERKKVESDLKHRALHDPLTDLANRTLFFDRLKQAMLGSNRDRRPVALVILDLDDFKAVNDVFGHVAGDAILRHLAVQLQAGLRSTDTVARIGGDEFAWILPNIAAQGLAVRKVRGLLRTLPRTYSFEGNLIEVGVTGGMALFPDDGNNADSLMRHADQALYWAKRQGSGLAFVGQQVRAAGTRLDEPKRPDARERANRRRKGCMLTP